MKTIPKLKRNLSKIILFGVMWGIFGLLYVLIEYGLLGDATHYPSTKNPYNFDISIIFTPALAFIVGCILGAVEFLFFNKLFVNRPFWKKIVFKSLIYLLSILFMLLSTAIFMNSTRMGLSLFNPIVIESIYYFIDSFAFWSIVIYAFFMIMMSLYIADTSYYLGGGVFSNFFTGKYHHPVEEARIFMFLDMKSSTTIAEQLGHRKYFSLLNQYYADTTDAIVNTFGEVYQYAGDEIIVSWDLQKGLQNNNCLRCFSLIKETFAEVGNHYSNRFGLVPKFKAGFHCGTVTTGEIGVLKKEIFFTGDVMNTTARIQGMCNELQTDILVSDELLAQLEVNDQYAAHDKGYFALKGKQEKIKLFTVSFAS